jgi:arylsulfatase A-like enzyme
LVLLWVVVHHGMFLYDETIHVPLLFKLPKGLQAGRRVQGLARLVDVAPTILQEVGLPVPKAMQGESLLSMMKIASQGSGSGAGAARLAAGDRSAYAESDYPQLTFGWSALPAWRTSKYLYVDAPDRELYDQASDPQALTPSSDKPQMRNGSAGPVSAGKQLDTLSSAAIGLPACFPGSEPTRGPETRVDGSSLCWWGAPVPGGSL